MKRIKWFSSISLGSDAGLRPLILSVLFTVIISASILAIMDINCPFMLALIIALGVSSVLTLAGFTAIGSWASLFASFITLSILIFKNNGIRDTAIMGLIVILIGAGLLAGKTGTLIIGGFIILEISIYGALETKGILVNKFSDQNYFEDYLVLCMIVAMITALQWLVISRLKSIGVKAQKDLEERKKVQGQLEEAEARYRGLVESVPLVIYIAEPGVMGKWHFVSPQVTKLTGFSPEDWVKQPGLWYSRIHPADRDRTIQDETEALREGKMPRLEYRLLTRDEQYIWISDESYVFVDTSRLLVQGFMLDITSRKLAEEQLTKRVAELQAVHGISEKLVQRTDLQKLIFDTGEQIRQSLKANNVLIAIHDPNTNLIHFPYDFEEGVPRKDVPIHFGEGMTTYIMEHKSPVIIENEWDRRAGEMNVLNANSLPAKSSVSVPIMTPERVIGVITIESTEHEYAFSESDSQLLMTIAANLAVAIEKTRLQESVKKEMEIQEKLIRELEVKNEELERFTYTASHDLKSPLITIRGFLGYLEQDARAGKFERLVSDIQRISDATEKMHRLLSELLDLSRVGRVASEKQNVPFEAIVTEALKRVEGQIKEKQVEVQVRSGFPVVHVDKERLIEVIQNLVDNAVKFMGKQPSPHIEIGFNMQDGNPIFFVRDNGIGIKKEFQKKIFGLFDKLNPATDGTGVGLALVKRIIEVYGGSIWVESQEGMGATFYFSLEKNNEN